MSRVERKHKVLRDLISILEKEVENMRIDRDLYRSYLVKLFDSMIDMIEDGHTPNRLLIIKDLVKLFTKAQRFPWGSA